MTKLIFDETTRLSLVIITSILELMVGVYFKNMISPFICIMILIMWLVIVSQSPLPNGRGLLVYMEIK